MNYDFPIIRTIDDVLPHIQGWDAIGVYERDFGTVINYQVVTPGLFGDVDENGELELGAAIRRECRGIIFNREGYIASRPFHKFFNVGEKEETQFRRVPVNKSAHTIYEKSDGSMVRPLVGEQRRIIPARSVSRVTTNIYLGTKMGFNPIGDEAFKLLSLMQIEYIAEKVYMGFTPLFEYVGPTNKIVVDYEDHGLVYLGTRENVTGEYSYDWQAPFEHVRQFGFVKGNFYDFVERSRAECNKEGYIIRFDDGNMVKIKNDWYVRIHKAKEKIVFDRNIVALELNNDMDDVLAFLEQPEIDRINALMERFWNAFKAKSIYLRDQIAIASEMESRKEVAMKLVPTLKSKMDAQFVFKGLDGANLREMLLEKTLVACGNNTKFDDFMKWLENN